MTAAYSPLTLARSFERFRAETFPLVPSETALLRFIAYWQELSSAPLGDAQTYVEEFSSQFCATIMHNTLADLYPNELGALRAIIATLLAQLRNQPLQRLLENTQPLITQELVKKLLFVGETTHALEVASPGFDVAKLATAFEATRPIDPLGRLQTALEKKESMSHDAYLELLHIFQAWSKERNVTSINRVLCLFVEEGTHDSASRGRLRHLLGIVEFDPRHSAKDSTEDAIYLNKKPESHSDVTYAALLSALTASRVALESGKRKPRQRRRIIADFSIETDHGVVTGGSLGLAAALVAYTELHRAEVSRYDCKLAGDFAVTGGVTDEGATCVVNERTLKSKITRAFFSTVRAVVLPAENLPSAESTMSELRRNYPNRRLQLIGIADIREALADQNLMSSRRRGIFETARLSAAHVAQKTVVQIPLLILLILLLGLLAADHYLPECDKPWGNCNPAFVQIKDASLNVFNSDSTKLWSKEYDHELIDAEFAKTVADLDGDGQREVLLLVHNDILCQKTHHLLAYSKDGRLLWDVDCRLKGEYPGDMGDSVWYSGSGLFVIQTSGLPVIVSTLNESNPSRTHIILWDSKGERRSTFVNAGSAGPSFASDVDSDGREELVFAGINRRALGATVFVLRLDSTFGVSPPYSDPNLDLSWVTRGNPLHYVVCPATKLCASTPNARPHPVAPSIRQTQKGDPASAFHLVTGEGNEENELYYYFDSRCRVVKSVPGDKFVAAWSLMLGKDSRQIDWNALTDTLTRAVMYYTDSGWVTEGALRDTGQ